MCTCCITWWPRHPVFCWIERGRRSRAVEGYVTSWARACLSVLCGVELRHNAEERPVHAAAASGLRPRRPRPSPPLFLFFLSSRPGPSSTLWRMKALLATLWPRCTGLPLPVCPIWSQSSTAPLLLRASPMCKWLVQVFSATLHHPPSSCCCPGLHNVWL